MKRTMFEKQVIEGNLKISEVLDGTVVTLFSGPIPMVVEDTDWNRATAQVKLPCGKFKFYDNKPA